MKSLTEIKEFVKRESLKDPSRECCGLILEKDSGVEIVPCENVSPNPEKHFIISPLDVMEASKSGKLIGFYHSHVVEEDFKLSKYDKLVSQKLMLNSIIYSVTNDKFIHYEPNKHKPDYVNRPFIIGLYDCFTLAQDYYKYALNIHIPDPIESVQKIYRVKEQGDPCPTLLKPYYDKWDFSDPEEFNNIVKLRYDPLSFYKITDKISDFGIKNNFGFYFKNLNTVAKNNNEYKSSPQMELMSIFEFNSSLPLRKTGLNSEHIIEPKLSFRFNPGDMKNYNSTKRIINADNIFEINRLGLSDSFESGKSLTIGINYKKTALNDINKYFEAKISTVLRDEKQDFIPKSSTINNRNSNLFGSITYNHEDHFKFDYDYILDNDFNTFNYNSLSSEFNYKNFTTELKFIEENNIIGNSNSIENNFEYEFNDNNFLSFRTRRNRTISLTEYYDLLYEYKNDCLTAGFKYKKTYYQDRDLKPKEDLLLTITFFPLTTYEQEIDQDLYRN
mgnify:CR=1 FL=1